MIRTPVVVMRKIDGLTFALSAKPSSQNLEPNHARGHAIRDEIRIRITISLTSRIRTT